MEDSTDNDEDLRPANGLGGAGWVPTTSEALECPLVWKR
jgi:hypothetical protein